ncbi:MAG: helix-turn-helix domain-containing protein [Proteobacteria bacterium]|nr:helix-turn-helix domain-containing protein [Pseudomonadota bacterium]
MRTVPDRHGQEALPPFGPSDGVLLRAFRERLGINQRTFWGNVFMTQSGGSRYEQGRNMSPWLSLLLRLVYGRDEEAREVLSKLRLNSRACVTSSC